MINQNVWGGGLNSRFPSISVLLRKSKKLYVMDFIELNDITLEQIASAIRDEIALFRDCRKDGTCYILWL